MVEADVHAERKARPAQEEGERKNQAQRMNVVTGSHRDPGTRRTMARFCRMEKDTRTPRSSLTHVILDHV